MGAGHEDGAASPRFAPVEQPRVLVVGCGGIGGVLLAGLLEHDTHAVGEVLGLSSNAQIADAIHAHGLKLAEAEGSVRTVRAARVTARVPAGTPPFDWVFLATQPPQVEAAARAALPLLAPGGAMVCLQNGLCEPRVAEIAGPDRVLGAVVAWGASMVQPGLYERTSSGGFTVGRMDGADDPRLAHLALLLEPVGPVTVTTNLVGARWSKLAINCAVSTLGALSGERLGPLLLERGARRLALEIMTEAVAVARAERVRLEKVAGTIDLDWIALTDADRRAVGSPGLLAKHSMLLAVGARYRRLRSSMLAAIERGRPPAVDFLNGEVVARGRRHGLATPYNAAAVEAVQALARGTRTPSKAALARFAAQAARAAAAV